jgi:hypothetical protein
MSIYGDDWGDVPDRDSPRTVSHEAQQQGMVRASRYVPALIEQPTTLTTSEQGLLSQAAQAASHLLSHRQVSHLAKSEETPVENAVASLIYSVAYAAIAAGIALVLALLGMLLFGGDERIYVLLAVLGWGIYVLRALRINREQGLEYSPAGLEHHEIESRVEMGKYIVDKHIELIKERWQHKD